jgi:hypothetical protein
MFIEGEGTVSVKATATAIATATKGIYLFLSFFVVCYGIIDGAGVGVGGEGGVGL